MSFLNNSNSEFLTAKITHKGRNAIAKGSFNIQYFQVGDSEYDYNLLFSGMTGSTSHQKVFAPFDKESGVKYPYNLDSTTTSANFGIPVTGNTTTTIRNVMGPAGFVSDYKTLDDITIACPVEKVYYSAITGTNKFILPTGNTFQNCEYVTLVTDNFGGIDLPTITGNSNSYIYKITNYTGSTTGVTLTLDRNTPVLTGLTGYAQLVRNKCEIEFPITSEISPVCLPEPIDPMGQLNPWTMNIVWDKKPIGSDVNTNDENLSGYTSNGFISTKELLGYSSTGQTFVPFSGISTSGITITGTTFKNSFDELIEVKPEEQRCIAVIHYSELGDLRNDPERFFKYDDYISYKTGTTGDDISIITDEDGLEISDTNYFEIYIPFVYYHRNTGTTMGARFMMDTTDYYIKSTINAKSVLLYRYLLDEQNNKVGKVFVKNKTVVFDDQEIVAMLDYKSNRRYTLPSPKLGLTPSDGITEHSMLTSTGQTAWVTYYFGNTINNKMNALPCNYFNKITGTTVPSHVTIKFSGNSFSNMITGLTYDKFYADKFYALVQINTGQTPSSDLWRTLDLTSQIPTTNGTNNPFINPSNLTGVTFTLYLTGLTVNNFDLEDHMSGLTTNYLGTATTGDTMVLTPQFGDEQPFPGSVRLVRSSDLEQMNFLINLPSSQFTKTNNPTYPLTGTLPPKKITEIALLDSNKEPLVIAKTTIPITRSGTQVFAVKLDF
jgi:hypothetical protein